jgi:hypothetical protein
MTSTFRIPLRIAISAAFFASAACGGFGASDARREEPWVSPGDRRGDGLPHGARDAGPAGPYFEIAVDNDVAAVTAEGVALFTTDGTFLVEGSAADGARVRVFFPRDTPDRATCNDRVRLEYVVPVLEGEHAPGEAPGALTTKMYASRTDDTCILHIEARADVGGAIEATFHGTVYDTSSAEPQGKRLEGFFRAIREGDVASAAE